METSEIPQIKLAKVGKQEQDKERKKAGLAWWLRSGRTASDLLRGGAGQVGGWLRALARFLAAIGLGEVPLASLLTKALIAMLLAAGCVGAYNFGQTLAPDASASAAKPKLFDSHEAPTKVAGSADNSQSGLSMVSGSLNDGADAQKADQAATDKNAAGDGTKEAPDATAAGKAEGAGEAEGAGKSGHANFGSKFGQLSSGLGSGHAGLAGGAGMSSGVGRPFEKLGMAHAMAKAAAPNRGKATPSIRARKGKAFNQLKGANLASRQGAAATAADPAAVAADSAFSNNHPVAATIASPVDAMPQTGSGASTPSDTNPTSNPTSGTEPGTTTTGTPTATDVTPWKGQMKMAAMMLMIGCALLMAAAVVSMMQFPQAKMIAQVLGGLAAMVGAAIIAMAMKISGFGGGAKQVGQMFMASGGLLTAGGAVVAIAPMIGKEAVSMTIPAIVAGCSSLFAGLLGMKGMQLANKLN